MSDTRSEPITQTSSYGSSDWQHCLVDSVKFNCDNSWCQQTMTGGIGGVARDSNATIIGGLNCCFHATDPEVVEARAVFLGIWLVIERRWSQAIINQQLMSSHIFEARGTIGGIHPRFQRFSHLSTQVLCLIEYLSQEARVAIWWLGLMTQPLLLFIILSDCNGHS